MKKISCQLQVLGAWDSPTGQTCFDTLVLFRHCKQMVSLQQVDIVIQKCYMRQHNKRSWPHRKHSSLETEPVKSLGCRNSSPIGLRVGLSTWYRRILHALVFGGGDFFLIPYQWGLPPLVDVKWVDTVALQGVQHGEQTPSLAAISCKSNLIGYILDNCIYIMTKSQACRSLLYKCLYRSIWRY